MNPKNDEHHYGSVFHAHHPDRDPPFDPKPSYKAAKTLTETLSGFHFAKRLAVGGPDDYVLLFKKGEELRLAAWTRSKETRKLLIPADSGLFKAVDHTGEVERTYLSTSQGLCLPLRDGPQYLIAPPSTDLLQEATAWTPRYEHQIRGREKECLVNPLK